MVVKDLSLGISAAEEVGIDATMGKNALGAFQRADGDLRTTVGFWSCLLFLFLSFLFFSCFD